MYIMHTYNMSFWALHKIILFPCTPADGEINQKRKTLYIHTSTYSMERFRKLFIKFGEQI